MFAHFIEQVGLCNCSVKASYSKTVASLKGEPYINPDGKCRKSPGTTLYIKRTFLNHMHHLLSNLRQSALDLECCDDN